MKSTKPLLLCLITRNEKKEKNGWQGAEDVIAINFTLSAKPLIMINRTKLGFPEGRVSDIRGLTSAWRLLQ
jgi:hypothetical protein